MSSLDLLILLAVPLATALACRLLRDQRLVEMANVGGATVTLVAGLALALRVFAGGPIDAVGGRLRVDELGAFLVVLVVLVGFLAALYSVGYLQRDVAHGKIDARRLPGYYAAFHAFVWTMLFTGVVDDLGLLWVGIEATTLVSAILVGFYRTKAALEAAWKYLILCTVGITFALFGVLLTYYASLQALDVGAGLGWSALLAGADRLDPGLMKLAFVFIVVGFGTKAGLAPLHMWLPDAHSQAPSPVSAMLSAVLLKCGLYGILRFYPIVTRAVTPEFATDLLLGFGLFSVVVAVPFILVQRDLKRLLAYSSVEHVGLIVVAVGFGGPLALFAGVLHALNHAVAKTLLFFVAGDLAQRYGTTRMASIRGAFAVAPVTGTLLLAGAFAITGLPPFAIFVTEFGIVGAGFATGHWVAAAVVVVALAAVFAGVLAHALGMAFGKPREGLPKPDSDRLGWLALGVPAGLVVLLGVFVPSALAVAVEQVATLLRPA